MNIISKNYHYEAYKTSKVRRHWLKSKQLDDDKIAIIKTAVAYTNRQQ